MDIFARTIIALSVIFIGWGVYQLYNRALQLRTPSLLADLEINRPFGFTLVYFTTPTCAPCKTVQRPAIEKVSKQLGNQLNVIEIDAAEKPEIASRWGVMSVPTTFVFDPKGELRHINHGVTRAEKLLKQIEKQKTA